MFDENGLLNRRYTLLPPGAKLFPNQEQLIPHILHRDNVLILWSTSSGKSKAVPMLGTKELDNGKNILYVASFKALADEKYEEWGEPDQPWEPLPRTSITGDYTYDTAKIEEIQKARLISITPESLVSCIRNQGSDKSQFLTNVGIIFIDEGHLVAEPGRGASMEAAIIEFLQDHPDVRLVVMSGTIPNWQEYADWMTQLNGRTTHICRSDFRPVVLKQHFLKFTPGATKMSEAERRHKIEAIVTSEDHENKQFLVCFFKKKFGNDVIDSLKSQGVNAEFHSADLKELTLRQAMEKRFKRATTRVLGCTQTLITGVNLPAWGVIITATENGGGEIPAYTLQQAAGRAGRPKYDTEGNVWFLIPDDGKGSYDYHVRRIRLGEEIKSQMIHKEVVATHFLGALYLNRFKNLKDFDQWYHRTLAYVQGNMSETEVKELLLDIVDDMQKRGMIRTDDSGAIELRNKGKICAQLLLDPYFFADMIANFRMYFTVSKPNDVDLAIAMTRSNKFYSQWMSFEERQAVPDAISKSPLKQEYWKHAAAVYHALQGKSFKEYPFALRDALWQVKEDLDRTCLAMVRACNESEMWTEDVYDTRGRKQQISADEKIRLMFLRVKHGVTWERSRGMVAGLSRSDLNALNSVGITDLDSARKNIDLVSKVMKESRMRELRIA